jgi:vacuolar-type H+-ATPase subunit D/Vma8
MATQAQASRAVTSVQQADAEIERFQEVMRQIGELQTELTKIQRIGEIVKSMRARVEALDRRI